MEGREEAEQIAERGAASARAAGWDARPLVEHRSPVPVLVVPSPPATSKQDVVDMGPVVVAVDGSEGAERDAAVVVVGSRGRSGGRELILGSVAKACSIIRTGLCSSCREGCRRRRDGDVDALSSERQEGGGPDGGVRRMTVSRCSGPVTGVVFDLDGVLTDTAALHAAAWTRLFDDVFARYGCGRQLEPFGAEDYLRLVDGRPRLDGLANVLRSRDIVLPLGSPGDAPETETMHGVAERKDRLFVAQLHDGVPVFAASRPLLAQLVASGVPVAVVSASRHAGEVLERTGLRRYVAVLVDGHEAQRLGLPGKPDPATFLLAARRLGVQTTHAAVVEDAVAGVEAGRRAGFALVVGVDRHDDPTGLQRAGADLVVADLADLDAALLGALG